MMNVMTLDDVFDQNLPINEKVLHQTREMLQKVSKILITAVFYDLRTTLIIKIYNINQIYVYIYLLENM